MPLPLPLSVEIDVSEPRLAKGRLIVSGQTGTWDLANSENVWENPATNDISLAPLVTLEDWRQIFTGDYARTPKSAYTLPTPSAWKETELRGPGDYFLTGISTNEGVRTTANCGVNQPIVIEQYLSGTESFSNIVVLECGWGAFEDAGSVWLKIAGDGTVAVYKAGSRIGFYQPSADSVTKQNVKIHKKAKAARWVTWMLIPTRFRELSVVNTDGEGFSHPFDDLLPQTMGQAITPSAPFYWRVPVGQPVIQLAALHYAGFGTLYGRIVRTRFAPDLSQVFGFLNKYSKAGLESSSPTATAGLYTPNLAPFDPNGVDTLVRVGAVLAGDGDASLAIQSIDAKAPPVVTTTYGAAVFDASCCFHRLTMKVDRQGRATLTLAMYNPAKLASDGLAHLGVQGDRPIRIAVGEVDIFRGTLDKPTIIQGQATDDSDTEIVWEGQDRSRQFELSTFADSYPYDGLLLTDVIQELVTECGFDPSDLDISPDTFTLPVSSGVGEDTAQYLPDWGDTRAQWLDRLHRDFAATWIRGWIPTLSGYKYRFLNPALLSLTPAVSLYWDFESAAAGGLSSESIYQRVIRSAEFHEIPAEANQIIVMGQDPRTKGILWSQYDDALSQNPETSPDLRPANWRGQVVTYTLIEPYITTQEAADRVKNILAARLAVSKEHIRFECEFLVRFTDARPLWITDVVRIYQPGSHTLVMGDYRIIEIPEIEIVQEDEARGSIRRAVYIAELL